MRMDEANLDAIIHRGVAEIIDESEFVSLLRKGKPLRLKMGFDPSRPDIHLGHVVGLRKLRQLQEFGHQVILIVGDWTAQIGDPSGHSVTRPMLTHQEVVANAESYMKQFFRVVDPNRTQTVWQSEWFGKFTLADIVQLTSRFTVAQFLQREDFRRRWDAGRPIAVTELLYPLLQAYDSVAVGSDVEFGGTDQKFNLLVGRQLQSMLGHYPQQCFTVPILVGTDGTQKMSKSLGNYIGVEEPPQEQYGKIMSLGDDLIVPYFELLTDTSETALAEISRTLDAGENPMDSKKRLAREIVTQFWGAEEADSAAEHFERVFQRREAPEEMPTYDLSMIVGRDGASKVRLTRLMVDAGLASSLSDARRLVQQRAVEVDGERLVEDMDVRNLKPGSVLRVGRRRFLRLIQGV